MRRYGWAWIGATALGAGLAGTAGCTVYEEPHPRHHAVVYQEPPPPPPPAPVVVEPAPAPLVEVVPVAPGPAFFWVPGRYYRERGAWVWHRGYYDRRHY